MATIIKVGIKVADLKANDKGYADINVAINDEINQWNQMIMLLKQTSTKIIILLYQRKTLKNW